MIKEISPLTHNDCFTIFSSVKNTFSFPLHFHEEYELNLILNAAGAKRIIGDNVEIIDDIELVLIGPNLSHVWLNNPRKSDLITELTIQWHKDLFDEKFMKRNQMLTIKTMLERSAGGISFPKEVAQETSARLIAITKLRGFDAVLELMSILHKLSCSASMRMLSDTALNNHQTLNYHSRRLEKAFEFMHTNFQKQITLKELSKLVSMTEVSFSRFIKKHTGKSFIDTMNEIRLGQATRMLMETKLAIAEVSYNCGFHNISHFNRLFKKKKQCTPKEFREKFSGTRIFI